LASRKFVNIFLEILQVSFLNLFLFGFLIKGFTPIKYIGLYGSIFMLIIRFFFNKKIIFNYFYFIQKYKIHFIAILFIIISILLSIFSTFPNFLESLDEFRGSMLNIILFFIISLSLKKENLIYYIFTIIISLMANILIYTFSSFHYFNIPSRIPRDFSDKAELLFPFLMAILFLIKKNYLFYLGIFLSIFTLFLLLLTGARGGWISVGGEVVIISVIIFFRNIKFLKKRIVKKMLFIIIGFLVTFLFIIFYLIKYSPFIKHKFYQGLSSNGRDIIVKTRFPIFWKYGNFWVGIGGPGNYQYNAFLQKHNAPKRMGEWKGKKFLYYSDEPFLLQIFYKEGIIGVISFLFFIVLFIISVAKELLKKKNSLFQYIFYTALLSSFIGTYIIRGLVEAREFKYLFFYLIIFIALKEYNENSLSLSRNSSE